MNEISLLEMLNAREIRVAAQKQLIHNYHVPVICFTMNIPGPVKVFPGIPDAYMLGCRQIETALHHHGISLLHQTFTNEHTGYEAYYCVDGEPIRLKEITVDLEDHDAMGRLFDIDVLRTDGSKVSREEFGMPPRRCLLCGEPAHACSRSRTHCVEDLLHKIHAILEERIGI